MADSLINTAPIEFEKGDFQADLAQSVGTRDARAGGMTIDRAMLKGFQARQTTKDPLYDLKVMEYRSRISENAAQAANYSRQLLIKNAEIVAEQRDRNLLTRLSLQYKGKPKEALQALSETNVESAWGLKAMNEQRQAITALMDMDAVESTWAKASVYQRSKAINFEKGSQEWWDAIGVQPSTNEPQSPTGKELADRMTLEKRFGANSPQIKKFDELTAQSASPTNLGKLLAERRTAPDSEKGYYDQAIGHLGQKMGISIQYDDQGRPIINYGPQKTSIGDPSVATQSMAQRKLLKYEAASELINDLQNKMQSGDVGLAGVLGEYVGDRILPQLGVDTFRGKRADVRSTMIAARESLLREISDDTRFSNLDREEISKALPSSGVFESLQNAQQRLSTVRNILNARGRTYSEGLGLPSPEWSLTPDEIKAQYDKFQSTGGKDGLSFEKAKSLLQRFHKFEE